MDPKGKGMVINDKEKESFVNEPNDDRPTDSGSGHKRKDGRKKTRRIKEIVYYDSDESSSSQKDNDDYDRRKTVRLIIERHIIKQKNQEEYGIHIRRIINGSICENDKKV